MGGWWRQVLVSPDGVVPGRMISVSTSVNLPLQHVVQKFPSGTGSPGWSRKKGHKAVVVCAYLREFCHTVIVSSQLNKVKTQAYQGDTDASDSQKFVPYMSAPPLRTGEF